MAKKSRYSGRKYDTNDGLSHHVACKSMSSRERIQKHGRDLTQFAEEIPLAARGLQNVEQA
jgi:hypothetical protein